MTKKDCTLTQQYLKEILHYNPDTGIFTWLVNMNNNRAGAGKSAGTLTNSGHIIISIYRNRYLAHRLSWFYIYGFFPKKEIDHIDHVGTNNKINNLRIVTHQENLKNQILRATNTSGNMGVVFDKIRNKWKAQIMVHYKNKHLGRFKKKQDAIKARKEAEIKYGFHKNHGMMKSS